MSKYANKTAAQREALAAARKPGQEVPKCAAFFDHDAGCDLFRSHHCKPSEIAIALATFLQGETK